jgi:carbamoyl-phosphate synthase large subunit
VPRREDITSILVIGSGPIIIGQASEFDYSGTQALKALKEENFRLILVNSNPATIMTDPEFADRTYLEPLTLGYLKRIIEKEKPDALLATLGGQKALNLALELDDKGILKRHSLQLIGVSADSIRKAEDRLLFRRAMGRIRLEVPASGYASNLKEAVDIVKRITFPVVLRPSFTLGGTGGNIVNNWEDFYRFVPLGLAISPISRVLIEKSIIGWKEYELEVMRDKKDNVVIVCPIENLDPMGVHTGDSITVAPAQTLTDKEYQRLRDASIAIMREIGVETGGSNIQFAVNPEDGQMMVIEMNPRVSRSSALASKATGFPIAKIAAKLAVGYTLDEILNDITKKTPACFEPAIDYVVVKIPRFAFEKFPEAERHLTTQMKSVGETMAIGRTFKESLQKAIRSLESERCGLEPVERRLGRDTLRERLRQPNADRLWLIADAFRLRVSVEDIHEWTRIDPFFLHNIREIVAFEDELRAVKRGSLPSELLRRAKEMGFSDRRIGQLAGLREDEVRKTREDRGLRPVWKVVDTCAGEFESETPYFYSTYEEEDEVPPLPQKKAIILGSGPNRIGQGIEFDYCCVHGVFALRDAGYKTIMINSNPETVSTDYDISDRLYFDPLTLEDVLAIYHKENPEGVIVQFGGQTPLKISNGLHKNQVRILGTSSEAIDETEDREKFDRFLKGLGLLRPRNGLAKNSRQALRIADRIGFPVLIRPSYVLGGRAMKVIHDEPELARYIRSIRQYFNQDLPLLIDEFVENAMELDVDLLGDGEDVYIGGVLEHIQEAGVHSGDATMVIPPYFLADRVIEEVRRQVELMARELKVVGLMNVQLAVKGTKIYILEVNPRASRTVPFVSKATGVPLAKIATRLITGEKLRDIRIPQRSHELYAVKEAVFSFDKFLEVDPVLGPEMRSTGESIGIDREFSLAFLKSQEGAGFFLPQEGEIFVSVPDEDKPRILPLIEKLGLLGFTFLATEGTGLYLKRHGFAAETIGKVYKERRNILDDISRGKVKMIFNTPSGTQEVSDAQKIRRVAFSYRVPCYTTIPSASAAVKAIETRKKRAPMLVCLQDLGDLSA